MRTMDMALRELYESGQVEYEDVLRYLDNPRSIAGPGGAALTLEAPGGEADADPPPDAVRLREP